MPYNDVLPPGADKISFVQKYIELCQKQLPAGAPPIDPKNVTVSNRVDGDGKYQLLFNDTKNDVYCSAEVNWGTHEITVLSGKLSEAGKKQAKNVGAWSLSDTCEGTEKLFGKDEFAGYACKPPSIDDKVKSIQNFTSFKLFQDNCEEALSKHGLRFVGQNWRTKFDLKNVHVVNDVAKDGIFNIIYQNPRQNFFCGGLVDSTAHTIYLNHGSMTSKEEVPDGAFEMTDACSITNTALGDKEVVGKCDDRTKSERSWEETIGTLGGVAIALYTNYRLGQSILKSWRGGYLLRFRSLPFVQSIARNLPWAYMTFRAYDTFAEHALKLPKDDPVRKNGAYVAAGVGLVAPEIIKRTIAVKLAERSLVSKIGLGATRFAGRAALVGALDMVVGGIINDYKQDVNRRVTDQIYDKWVYSFDGVRDGHWYDAFAVPLMPVRAGARWLAPNAIDWSVADPSPKFLGDPNKDIREAVLKEDRDNSTKNLDFMREAFSVLDSEDIQIQEKFRKDMVEKLKTPQTLSSDDNVAMILLRATDAEKVKTAKGWNDEQFGEFLQRVLPYQIQTAAQYMYSIEQDHAPNKWAREVFKEDGTIAPDMESKFLENVYFPAMAKKPE